jgi:fibronectin-binding autotransporter adhesin
VTKHGDLQLTSTSCSGDTASVVSPGLTNSGILDIEPGTGGARDLSGTFVSSGTTTVNADADLLTGSSFTNNGTVNIADSEQWTIDASTSTPSTFTNGAAGSINSNGTDQTGVLYEDSGNSFTEAGTTNVANTYVDTSNLTYSGSGASQVTVRGTGTVAGAPASGQTLIVQGTGCGEAASQSLTGSATNAGTIQLTSVACSGEPDTLTVPTGDTLTNTGILDIEPGTGGARDLSGTFVSSGTTTVNADADLLTGSSFTNNGTVNIADSEQWTIDASTSTPSTFTNGAAGSINSNGTDQTGVLYEDSGNSFTEAGTTNVANTYVDTSNLTYSGSGASQVTVRGTGTVAGAPASGQTLIVQGTGCGEVASQSLTGSATNAGTIQLTSVACSGEPDTLTVPTGDTLTNTGTLDIEPGTGNTRTISGSIVNKGTVTVNTSTSWTGPSWDNEGHVTIADGMALTVPASSAATFSNEAGGQVSTTGDASTGDLSLDSGNSLVEGTGTISGGPAYVDDSALTYTGSGASEIVVEGTGTLTGAPSVGQTLVLEGTGCSQAADQTLTGSATNAGTIELTTAACSGEPVTLAIASGFTLTNSGTLETEVGAGNTRTITGNITNTGSISLAAKTIYKPATLFHNEGAVTASTGGSLSIKSTKRTVVFNDTGGSFKGPASVSGGTFEQGNGVLKSSVTTTNTVTDFVGTGTGSVIAKNTGSTLEGSLVAHQSYTIEGVGCGKAATATTAGAVVNGGTITLTTVKCSGEPTSLIVGNGSSLTNTGAITVVAGTGSSRTITGSLINEGTVTIDANTSWSGGNWDNKGSVSVADSVSLLVPASSASTFTNDTGGSVITTGDASTGDLYLDSGNAFVEGAGTTSGGPVYVDTSNLTYSGSGASQVTVRGTGTVAGAPASGQTLIVQGTGCGEAASQSLTGSATNAGTIQLTSVACSGEPDTLTVPTGDTLTNTGILDIEPGTGGARDLSGTFVSSGTTTVNADADLLTGSSFTNNGTVNIADSEQWTIDASTSTPSTFTNGAAGSINSNGTDQTGVLYEDAGNSFTEAGTTNVANTYVDTSNLTYSGSGASQVTVRGTGTVAGAPASGQTLIVQGTGCGEVASQSLTGSATNAGTIQLTSVACSGEPDTLTVPTGDTLTNTGTLQAFAGAGGTRTITGKVINKGTIGASDGPTLNITGNYTQTSAGDLQVTVPTSTPTLTVSGTATLAGELQAVPTSGSSFTAGDTYPALSAGTVSGTFSTVTGGSGQTWSAVYSSTEVELEYDS